LGCSVEQVQKSKEAISSRSSHAALLLHGCDVEPSFVRSRSGLATRYRTSLARRRGSVCGGSTSNVALPRHTVHAVRLESSTLDKNVLVYLATLFAARFAATTWLACIHHLMCCTDRSSPCLIAKRGRGFTANVIISKRVLSDTRKSFDIQ